MNLNVEKLKECFFIGKEFESIEDFTIYMKKIFISNKIYYKVLRRDSKRINIGCKDFNCNFCIFVSWKKSNMKFLIKKCILEHNCDNLKFNYNGVASLILNENSDINVKELQTAVSQKYGIEISYHNASAALLAYKQKKK